MNEKAAYRDWPMAFRFSEGFPRFCYCSHIPAKRAAIDGEGDALLVAIHGSERDAMGFRDAFRTFSERTGCAVLAPLFPVSPFGDNNGDGYKFLVERNLRYDLILLQMVQELAARADRRFGRLLLFGFSGGAQFAHRFLYLHPRRLAAVSVAAPGEVTLLSPDLPLWEGTGGWAGRFGEMPDIGALRQVGIQLLIGSEDTEPVGRSGHNRQEQLARLETSLRSAGLAPQKAVVPGAAHDGLLLVPAATAVFDDLLAAGTAADRRSRT